MALDSALHLALTQKFIDERPIEIDIIRAPRVSDGQGGWTRGAENTLSSQTVRMVRSARLRDSVVSVSDTGQTLISSFSLIAMLDADILPGDRFTYDDGERVITYEVLTTNRLPNWRLQAEVIEYAE